MVHRKSNVPAERNVKLKLCPRRRSPEPHTPVRLVQSWTASSSLTAVTVVPAGTLNRDGVKVKSMMRTVTAPAGVGAADGRELGAGFAVDAGLVLVLVRRVGLGLGAACCGAAAGAFAGAAAFATGRGDGDEATKPPDVPGPPEDRAGAAASDESWLTRGEEGPVVDSGAGGSIELALPVESLPWHPADSTSSSPPSRGRTARGVTSAELAWGGP